MSAKTRISNLLESRFSESAERIEANSISFERFFKAQDSWNICFAFVTTFTAKKPVQIFVYLISEVLSNIYCWLELHSNKHARKSFLEKYWTD